MGNLELILWNKESEPGDANNFGEQSFNPIAHYSAGDTCLLIVNRFINRKELHNASPSEQELRLIDRDCYLDKYPIPNFWHTDYTVDKTQCRLPQDFEIYVLDAKPGKFKDDELLTDGRFMPEKWKNGYSVGYAVSKQRTALVYWLLIW